MSRSTTWARTHSRARLCAADPAGSDLDSGVWPSDDARAVLERIVEGSAEPAGLQLPPPVRRLGRRQVLPVAAVLVVLLVAAGVTLVHTIGGDNPSRRTGGPAAFAPTTSHAQGRSSAANKTAALAAVEYLLAAVPEIGRAHV